MDDLKKWAITYTYHTHAEEFCVGVLMVEAVTIGHAIMTACEKINDLFEENHWSDFIVTSANIVVEVH